MLAVVRNANKSRTHMPDAKAAHDRIIDKAAAEGPQTVTRHGRKTEVIVDAEDREHQTRRSGSLAEFFAKSPLPASGLEIERSKDGLRDIDL
jgi:prevent-host-death family protein